MSRQSTGGGRLGETALVCGAGIAGLLTARVLSDFFDRVVILERDKLIDEPIPRRGAPQSSQIHVLIAGGQRILSTLFPGFVEEMRSHQAPYVCITRSWRRYHIDAWQPNFESDLWTLFCSRGLLEWVVRRRVLALPNVELRSNSQVVGLVTSPQGGAVRGVRIRRAIGPNADTFVMPGDLIVDSTGRSSAGPRWLENLGYEPPEETTVNGFWGYASRRYRMRDGWAPEWSALDCLPIGQPDRTRGAFLVQQEGGHWILTLVGCAKDHPPRDERAFTEWVASLPVPDYADAISGATPLTEIAVWRQTFNRMRHYDRLTRRPERLLFVGDSVCTLNPVYGQGMTVAAWGARDLHASLTEQASTDNGLVGLAERFHHRLADSIRLPWVLATDVDHAIPGADAGSQGAEEAELGRRFRDAQILANDDPHLRRLVLETVMLVRTADWLHHGDVANRVGNLDEVTATQRVS